MTREERKRYNRRWFMVRLVAFIVCAAAFALLITSAECLADAMLALTCNG